jgi:hypothetical protein
MFIQSRIPIGVIFFALTGVLIALPAMLRAENATTQQIATKPATGTATAELARRLSALVPVLDTADASIHSLDASVTVGTMLVIRAVYQAPDRFALYLIDRHDDTPIAVAADQKLLVYDAPDGALLWSGNASSTLALKNGGKNIALNVGFHTNNKKPPTPFSYVLEMKTLLNAPGEARPQVTKLEDGRRMLHVQREHGEMQFLIDPQRAQACRRVRYVNLKGMTLFMIDHIRVNQAIDPKLFAMPPRPRLDENFTVEDWPGNGIFQSLGGMTAFIQLVTVRLSQHDTKERARIDKLFRIDWENVAASDRTIAPALRKIFPPRQQPRSRPLKFNSQLEGDGSSVGSVSRTNWPVDARPREWVREADPA